MRSSIITSLPSLSSSKTAPSIELAASTDDSLEAREDSVWAISVSRKVCALEVDSRASMSLESSLKAELKLASVVSVSLRIKSFKFESAITPSPQSIFLVALGSTLASEFMLFVSIVFLSLTRHAHGGVTFGRIHTDDVFLSACLLGYAKGKIGYRSSRLKKVACLNANAREI